MIHRIDRMLPSQFTLAFESHAMGIDSLLNPGRSTLTRLMNECSVKRDRLRDIEREIKQANTWFSVLNSGLSIQEDSNLAKLACKTSWFI